MYNYSKGYVEKPSRPTRLERAGLHRASWSVGKAQRRRRGRTTVRISRLACQWPAWIPLLIRPGPTIFVPFATVSWASEPLSWSLPMASASFRRPCPTVDLPSNRLPSATESGLLRASQTSAEPKLQVLATERTVLRVFRMQLRTVKIILPSKIREILLVHQPHLRNFDCVTRLCTGTPCAICRLSTITELG